MSHPEATHQERGFPKATISWRYSDGDRQHFRVLSDPDGRSRAAEGLPVLDWWLTSEAFNERYAPLPSTVEGNALIPESDETLLELDERRRVSLGRVAKHRRYLVRTHRDGTIVLTPAAVLPAKGLDRRPCHTDLREADYRIVNRYTGRRVGASDPDSMTVCADCGEEIEL